VLIGFIQKKSEQLISLEDSGVRFPLLLAVRAGEVSVIDIASVSIFLSP
jgi:hypothetical protein